MADSRDMTTKCGNMPTLGTGSLTTIPETGVIDSEAQTTKGTTIWEKSPDEIEDEVEALIKSREDNCPERKRRHDEFYKQWDEDEESLDMRHTYTRPSAAPKLMASLQKVNNGFAQLRELHSLIGKSMEKLASASTG